MLRCCLARSGLVAAVNQRVVNSELPSIVSMQTRSNYQVVLRKRLDKRTGKMKYEDWDYLVLGMDEPKLLNGTTLLNRHLQETVHVKPTELRRRLNSAKAYRRSVKRLEDLKNYIKFTQDAESKGSK